MTLITPDDVFLLGVIDGVPVYTAWSRRADPQRLADQLDSVPSEVRGPGCASPAVVSHATGESLSTLRTCAEERPAQDAAAPTAAGSDVPESSTSRTANQHADPSAGGDQSSPPVQTNPVRLSLAAIRRIRPWPWSGR